MVATIRRSAQSWEIRLTDPAEIALFGTPWIPLPLTSAASLEMVQAHVMSLGQYSGVALR